MENRSENLTRLKLGRKCKIWEWWGSDKAWDRHWRLGGKNRNHLRNGDLWLPSKSPIQKVLQFPNRINTQRKNLLPRPWHWKTAAKNRILKASRNKRLEIDQEEPQYQVGKSVFLSAVGNAGNQRVSLSVSRAALICFLWQHTWSLESLPLCPAPWRPWQGTHIRGNSVPVICFQMWYGPWAIQRTFQKQCRQCISTFLHI